MTLHFNLFCAYGRKVGAYHELEDETWIAIEEHASYELLESIGFTLNDIITCVKLRIDDDQWSVDIDNKDIDISRVFYLYNCLHDLDEWQLETLQARLLFDYPVSFTELEYAIIQIDDCRYYKGMNLDDYVEEYISSIGGVEQLGADTLATYFDWEAFTRDVEIEQAGGIVRSSSGEFLGYLEMY